MCRAPQGRRANSRGIPGSANGLRRHRSVEHSLLGRIVDRDVEPLPQQRHLLIVDTELKRRAVRDAHHIRCRRHCRRAPRSEPCAGPRIAAGRAGSSAVGGGVGADRPWIPSLPGDWQRQLGSRSGSRCVQSKRPPRASRAYPSTASRVDLGSASPFGVRRFGSKPSTSGAYSRRPAGRIVGLADLLHHRFGAGVEPIFIDPERQGIGNGIIVGKRLEFGGPLRAFLGDAGQDGNAQRLGGTDQRRRPSRLGRPEGAGVARQTMAAAENRAKVAREDSLKKPLLMLDGPPKICTRHIPNAKIVAALPRLPLKTVVPDFKVCADTEARARQDGS